MELNEHKVARNVAKNEVLKMIDDFRSCVKDGEKVNGNWIGKNYRSCYFDLEKWESK